MFISSLLPGPRRLRRLVDAPLVEGPVLLLLEAVILEQRVGRVLERGMSRGLPQWSPGEVP